MSAPIASPVYTLGPWQGNVADDWGVEWVVETEDGWSSSPPVRATIEERQNADGGWNGPGYYSPRVITLAGKALAPDRATMLAAKDRIKAAITARQRVDLRVDEAHMSRRSKVRLSDQIEISDWGAQAFNWSLILVAADPRRYSVDPIGGSTLLPASTDTGRTYARTYAWSYGGYTPGGTGAVTVTQAGDYDLTPAVITVTGPMLAPRVSHVQTGRTLSFNLTLSVGDSLVLDLGAKTALLNGANRVGTLTSTSAWFQLVPGTNEIQFRGSDTGAPTDPDPVMTVTASSAWT